MTTLSKAMASPQPVDSAQTQKVELLRSYEMFRDLPEAVIARLASRARTTFYPAGETIFSGGDEGRCLFIVVSGRVKISVPSDDGKEIVLNVIGDKQVFGEIALLDGQLRTADATSMVDSRLLAVDRRDFVALLLDQPTVGLALLGILSRRLRRTTKQVESLGFEVAGTRLVRVLFQFADIQGQSADKTPRIAITQRELGQAAALSRESTNKYLMAWQRAGWIRVSKGGCIILDPDALLRLVGDEHDFGM